MHAMDVMVTDDPATAPGSGADRLLLTNGARARLTITRCEGETEGEAKPLGAVTDLKVSPYPDKLHKHMWARMTFRTPASGPAPVQYEVRTRAEGGDWEQAFTPDEEQILLSVALDPCADPADPMRNRCQDLPPGSELTLDLSNLRQSTNYEFSVTPRGAACGGTGPTTLATYATPAREFTTVSPCFVASATYGSPLASQINVLRRFRDRYLASHAPGRAAIDVYYAWGPYLAAYVREHEWARSVSRALLDPIVSWVAWWLS
jgi:hypothetical protein